jgi:hypothetical protein
MIEAELQVVLNTLIEHDIQSAFKKWQKGWELCICMEGDYFDVASKPKVSDQMAVQLLGIMDSI